MRDGRMRVLGSDRRIIEESRGDEPRKSREVDVRVEQQNLAKNDFQADAKPQRIETQKKADDAFFGACVEEGGDAKGL